MRVGAVRHRAPQQLSEIDRWLPYRRPRAAARLRLFCFPYAGGSAAVFRDWPAELPEEVEVCAVQPPGRERRLSEPAYLRMAPLVEGLVEVLRPLLDRPFVLFGHSLGAKVAFEMARRLRELGAPEPAHVLASGCRAPHMPSSERPLHDLPHDELIDELHRLGGTPPAVLEHEELMELLLPLLRSDFELVETYTYEPGEPLACPLSAFGGTDDQEVPGDAVEGWSRMTCGAFRFRMLEGGHFFLHERRRDLLAEVRRDLAAHLAP